MCIVTEANSKHYNVLVSEDIPVVVAGKTLKRERKTQSSLLTIAILQAEMMQTQQLMLLSHHLRYVIYVSEKNGFTVKCAKLDHFCSQSCPFMLIFGTVHWICLKVCRRYDI